MRALHGGGAALAALTLAIAFVPPAEAGGGSLGTSHGLEYTKAALQGVTSQAGPEAECDGDDMVTGGGGSISGNGANEMLHASYQPGLDGLGWAAEGSTTGATPRTVKAYAVCGPKLVEYQAPESTRGPGQEFSYGDICTSTEARTTGGGVYAEGGNLQVVAMRPDLTGPFDWLTSIKNLSSQNLDVTRVWVCSEAYDLRYRSQQSKVDGGKAGRAIAHCRGDEAVTGGGLVTATTSGSPHFKTWTLESRPVDSRADDGNTPDDGWLARAYNSAGHRLTLTAYAVCRT